MTASKKKVRAALAKREKKAMLLCAVGHRGTISRDFEYVEILDAKGPLLGKEMKRLIRSRAPYLSLDDFSDRQELTAAMPKSCEGSFLPQGLWVLIGVPKTSENFDHANNTGIPLVVFDDAEDLTWRRPKAADGWAKRLGLCSQ